MNYSIKLIFYLVMVEEWSSLIGQLLFSFFLSISVTVGAGELGRTFNTDFLKVRYRQVVSRDKKEKPKKTNAQYWEDLKQDMKTRGIPCMSDDPHMTKTVFETVDAPLRPARVVEVPKKVKWKKEDDKTTRTIRKTKHRVVRKRSTTLSTDSEEEKDIVSRRDSRDNGKKEGAEKKRKEESIASKWEKSKRTVRSPVKEKERDNRAKEKANSEEKRLRESEREKTVKRKESSDLAVQKEKEVQTVREDEKSVFRKREDRISKRSTTSTTTETTGSPTKRREKNKSRSSREKRKKSDRQSNSKNGTKVAKSPKSRRKVGEKKGNEQKKSERKTKRSERKTIGSPKGRRETDSREKMEKVTVLSELEGKTIDNGVGKSAEKIETIEIVKRESAENTDTRRDMLKTMTDEERSIECVVPMSAEKIDLSREHIKKGSAEKTDKTQRSAEELRSSREHVKVGSAEKTEAARDNFEKRGTEKADQIVEIIRRGSAEKTEHVKRRSAETTSSARECIKVRSAEKTDEPRECIKRGNVEKTEEVVRGSAEMTYATREKREIKKRSAEREVTVSPEEIKKDEGETKEKKRKSLEKEESKREIVEKEKERRKKTEKEEESKKRENKDYSIRSDYDSFPTSLKRSASRLMVVVQAAMENKQAKEQALDTLDPIDDPFPSAESCVELATDKYQLEKAKKEIEGDVPSKMLESAVEILRLSHKEKALEKAMNEKENEVLAKFFGGMLAYNDKIMELISRALDKVYEYAVRRNPALPDPHFFDNRIMANKAIFDALIANPQYLPSSWKTRFQKWREDANRERYGINIWRVLFYYPKQRSFDDSPVREDGSFTPAPRNLFWGIILGPSDWKSFEETAAEEAAKGIYLGCTLTEGAMLANTPAKSSIRSHSTMEVKKEAIIGGGPTITDGQSTVEIKKEATSDEKIVTHGQKY